jgi:hypothetical protein
MQISKVYSYLNTVLMMGHQLVDSVSMPRHNERKTSLWVNSNLAVCLF